MKKSLLIICSILFTWATNAQIIFSGESPASIQGSYDMTYGDPGGGWGSPDLINPANAVIDTLALAYDDGTSVDQTGGAIGDSASCGTVISDVDVNLEQRL